MPGVVIVRDGKIVFRQIATGKEDRLAAAQLLAQIDRSLGTTGGGARSGYAALERIHVRLDLGGGVDEATRATAGGSLAALYPLHRYLLAGPWIRSDVRDGMLDLDGAIALRVPLLADTAAIHLTATGGYTVIEATGANAAGRIGVWLALNPTWAVQIDAGYGARRLDADPFREAFVTLGITRLVSR